MPTPQEWMQALVDYGIPLAKRKMEEGRLDLGSWGNVKECGTFACLLGWSAMEPNMQALGLGVVLDEVTSPFLKGRGYQSMLSVTLDGVAVTRPQEELGVEMGLSRWEADALFGPAHQLEFWEDRVDAEECDELDDPLPEEREMELREELANEILADMKAGNRVVEMQDGC
ncbi:MAG TPA: hypothetical protein VKA48_00335 [Gammaproteobacteria bacterium]|nr:hypothetical protein [Gammaproteobacteria bacterium]